MERPEPAAALPLAVDALTIDYGERRAVDQLSLAISGGEIYGLLGANGAGKSSTIRSIVGLVRPTAGSVRVFGTDAFAEPLRTKQQIGYVPETALLYEALTPSEFLEFVAGVRKLDSETTTRRVRSYAEAFRLGSELEEPIATLSLGTRQKVLLIAAFLHQPPLLVLDEPLNGLDPRSARLVQELLVRYVTHDGRGVLFSTHTMSVAQQLCHRIGILDHGVLRAEGNLTELRDRIARGDATLEEVFLRLTEEDERLEETARSLEGS